MLKNIKSWLTGSFAMITLAAFITLTSAAGNKAAINQKHRDPNPVTYYYTAFSDANSAIQNQANWTTSQGDLECDGETNLCQVIYDQSVYPTLGAFLSANDTKAKIETHALSVSYKDE